MPGFDIGHLIVIFFVAFLILGPDRMMDLARRAGKFTREAQTEWVKFTVAFQDGVENKPAVTSETPAASAENAAEALTTAAPGENPVTAPAELSPTETPNATIEPASPSVPAAIPSKRQKKPKLKPSPQTIPDHLLELRRRLFTSLIAILAATLISLIFSDTILDLLRAPAGPIKLIAFSPMDGFLVHFRVALYGGIFFSSFIWIYELMMFIMPGLEPHERRLIIPAVIATVFLFLMGNIFGYLMLKNMMAAIFTMFGSLDYLPSADPFISFVVFFLIATGISFELPMVLLVLIRLGWISHQTLRRQRKISYFVIFVFAELITPVADPIVAPTIVMLPMVILFEVALFVARFITPKPSTTAAASNSAGG